MRHRSGKMQIFGKLTAVLTAAALVLSSASVSFAEEASTAEIVAAEISNVDVAAVSETPELAAEP